MELDEKFVEIENEIKKLQFIDINILLLTATKYFTCEFLDSSRPWRKQWCAINAKTKELIL